MLRVFDKEDGKRKAVAIGRGKEGFMVLGQTELMSTMAQVKVSNFFNNNWCLVVRAQVGLDQSVDDPARKESCVSKSAEYRRNSQSSDIGSRKDCNSLSQERKYLQRKKRV